MIPAKLTPTKQQLALPKLPLTSHQQRDIKEAEEILLSIKLQLERRATNKYLTFK